MAVAAWWGHALLQPAGEIVHINGINEDRVATEVPAQPVQIRPTVFHMTGLAQWQSRGVR